MDTRKEKEASGPPKADLSRQDTKKGSRTSNFSHFQPNDTTAPTSTEKLIPDTVSRLPTPASLDISGLKKK